MKSVLVFTLLVKLTYFSQFLLLCPLLSSELSNVIFNTPVVVNTLAAKKNNLYKEHLQQKIKIPE
jgi:hypothetical protein